MTNNAFTHPRSRSRSQYADATDLDTRDMPADAMSLAAIVARLDAPSLARYCSSQ